MTITQTTPIPTGYYSILDPLEPDRVTHWRQTRQGALQVWPRGSKCGPTISREDVPEDMAGRDELARQFNARQADYFEQVADAIRADLSGTSARFARLASRCCICSRKLRDAESKTRGIGPECVRDCPASFVAAVSAELGRAIATGENTHPTCKED